MMDMWKRYKEKLKPRLEALNLTADEIAVIISVVSSTNDEILKEIKRERPQIKKAVDVNCEVFWITGDGDDPLSCIFHSQGFQSMPDAMRKYEELNAKAEVWDVVVRQCVATKTKIAAYYMLKPRVDQKRNLVIETAEEPE